MHVVAAMLPAREERRVELGVGATGLDLVGALGLAPDAHILVRGNLPISIDEPLVDGETIRILAVVSGGAR